MGSFGDPQKRNRVFLQAVKRDLIRMHLPIDTHGDQKKKLVTTDDVLNDLSEVEMSNSYVTIDKGDGKTLQILDHSKDGTHPLKAETERLHGDKPAHTVRRKDNIEHYKVQRHLTVRETARLQSFPDEFIFFGTRQQALDGIGNAVPVKMAKAIATCVSRTHKEIASKQKFFFNDTQSNN